MTGILLIGFMMLIGAIIGGITNSLAIKMLFRPYQARYIGKWKLPFTPGLIPKRRAELAEQLGKTVADHLLTPKGIKQKLNDPVFQRQVVEWAQKETNRLVSNRESAETVLRNVGIEVDKAEIRGKIAGWTGVQYDQWMAGMRAKTIREVVAEEWQQKANDGAGVLADYVQKQLTGYLSTFEARQKIGSITEKYLDEKGFLGNMIASFLGNEGLADKIQPALISYIESAEARAWIEELINNEMDRLLNIKVGEVEAVVGKTSAAASIGKVVAGALPLDDWLDKSVEDWLTPVKRRLIEEVVPVIMDKAGRTLEGRIEELLDGLHLQKVVEKEVESFPVERIEALILNISRKEFKMITYLGALLGGIIGIIQGIIVIWLA